MAEELEVKSITGGWSCTTEQRWRRSGHETVHGGSKSVTRAGHQGMMEKDSLVVLIKDRGMQSHHSKVFLILAQAWGNLVRVVAHCLVLTITVGVKLEQMPRKVREMGSPCKSTPRL